MYTQSLLNVTSNRATNKMYSSYGNQRRNANILRFTPPGFKFPIDVQFPPRCLPVCERCKKNFKTREHCRGRDCHTDLAWCETYVCVSLDNTCTGEDGRLLDGPFIAKVVPPIAFNLKGELNPLTPICAPCKDKNYTRTYCRQNKNHRQLPWSTVYVIVSLKPGVAPERSVSSSGDTPSGKRKKTNSGESVKVEASSGDSNDRDANDGAELKRKGATAPAPASGAGDNDAENTEADSESSPRKDDGIRPKQEDSQQGAEDSDDDEDKDRKDDQESGKESSSSLSKGASKDPLSAASPKDNPKKSKSSKEKKSDSDKGSPGKKSKSTKSKKNNVADYNEEDLEALKAIEAAKLENIPRSRTFLATVSSKLHRIEWVDIDPVLESQLPMLNENHPDNHVNDGYDMRNSNPMMHPSMQRSLGIEAMGGMNDMRNMNAMNRMRGQGGSSMGMNPMGGHSMGGNNGNGGGGMSAMNVTSSLFNDGMEPQAQMVGGQMSRLGGAQDMMSQMQMRQMELRMNQMQNQMQFDGMGGAIPFETPSMSNRMTFSAGGGGNAGFTSQQEMMQYEQAMRNSQMQFGDRNRMMAGMPFNAMGQSDFGSQISMDRMGMGASGHDMMSRAGMGGPGSDMMGMSRSGAGVGLSGQDMMRGMGGGQDMMRASAFERMRGMGGQDMMGMRGGMNMGMGGQDWRAMGDQQGMNPTPGGGYGGQGGGDHDSGMQDRGKLGTDKEKEV